MDHLKQVQRAVDYIDAHLEDDLDLGLVARQAGLSRWHFQRVFKSLTNETLKTYIRSRRLSHSLDQLLHTGRRIIDIAFAAGYESQESFTRAFKHAFRMTPHEFRAVGNKNLFLKKIQFDEMYLRHVAGRNVSVEPELYEQRPLLLVGLRTTFYGVDSEKNNLGSRLPPLWAAFLQRLSEIEARVPGVCYGVVQPTAPDSELLEYHAAVEIPEDAPATELPRGMVRKEIPGSMYAKFTHRGYAKLVDHTVSYAYSTWLMGSRMQHTHGPDLEIYDERYDASAEASVLCYALPVVPAPVDARES